LVREAAAGGATVVLVSHEADRAAALAHRSVAIAGGHLRAVHDAGAPLREAAGVA
jgi:ABC-type proline/glycine betaine transport system ATPase subunit